MKEQWSMDDSVAHASNRQQQRLVVQEQRLSSRSTSRAEPIVVDNDNNFGVSSSTRYANDSLWTGRSSSTTDCSLSSTSEYSPRPVCNECTVPGNCMPHEDILNKCQLDRSMSNVVGLSSVDTKITRDTLQCPICAFNTSNRLAFTDHLISRCTFKHDDADLTKAGSTRFPNRAIEWRRTPPREDESSFTLGERTEREMRKSDRSSISDFSTDWQSNGKKQQMKGFREGKCCKQCSYVANTKIEYWEHMRRHIKGFTCPECSFVTKYKHHMNHHWLSVHDGSKPFKCKKCSYTCVSKSMLTSHLKKHSNVYPYRCANCSYKTKFCNALKKHLRKKEHQPAMVLNADGSPNPQSIIDVYGTKRGPKRKSLDKKPDQLDGNVDVTTITNEDQLVGSVEPISSVSPLESPVAACNLAATTIGETTNNAVEVNRNVASQNRSIVTFPYSDLVAAFNLSSFLFREDVRETATDYAQRSDMLLEYTKRMNCNFDNLMVPSSFIENLAITCFDAIDNDQERSCVNVNDTIEDSSAFATSEAPYEDDESTNTPLDLRKTDVVAKNQLHLELSITDSSNTIGTSTRRKGKATKLEHRLVEESQQPSAKDTESTGSATVDKSVARMKHEQIKNEKICERTVASSTDNNRLICQYCEIAFGDAAMYSVHMGYHGFNDPYTCNMCGDQCTDKLSFFLHIGRSKHK